VEELRLGLGTLVTLSGDLRRRDRTGGERDALDALLRRPLTLRGIDGSALVRADGAAVEVVRAVGSCMSWAGAVAGAGALPAPVQAQVRDALSSGHPVLEGSPRAAPAFVAILPLGVGGFALVAAGPVGAPFAALDPSFLEAVGGQIGAALENADLVRRLEARSADLERLSVRMIRQHEDQRARLARELHDETAQVFAGLKLQLGALRESAPDDLAPRFARTLQLVDAGIRSIRNVTEELRPSVLDDLGLGPAVRALATDFSEWSGLTVHLEIGDGIPAVGPDAELVLFRAAQEALSNIARHAQASRVGVELSARDGGIHLRVADDGVGIPADLDLTAGGLPGRSGLFGLRERLAGVGGAAHFGPGLEARGLAVEVTVPVRPHNPGAAR